MLFALLLAGCWMGGGGEAPLVRGPAMETLPGLALNQASAADAKAWASAHGMDCKEVPSPRRETVQLRCGGELPVDLLPGRKLGGRFDEVLIAWPDNGAVHYVSAVRKYSLPSDAIADYMSAVAIQEGVHGAPRKPTETPTEVGLQAKMGRWATTWKSDGTELTVSVLKAAGPYVTVSESWKVPEVELTAQTRGYKTDGSSGASKKKKQAAAAAAH